MTDATREQILSTATRLFFTQGYSQTGINQLIEESGVAKRTFYNHFASKEDLGGAYLDFAARQWIASLAEATAGRRSALGVVRALFEHIEQFATDTRYRGCGVLNMASEFADAGSAVRERVRAHKEAQQALVRGLLSPFGVPAAVADQVNVLVEGAIAAAAGLLDVTPIRAAARAARVVVAGSSMGGDDS